MTLSGDIRDAIGRGAEFLSGAQLASGEFQVFTSTDPEMKEGCAPDPSIFPTALIAQSLAVVDEAAAALSGALDFLLAEMDGDGLWRHWPRAHPYHRQLPPDLDDTSCAASALQAGGRVFPDHRALLLANRDARGLFFTWLTPRARWAGAAHARVALHQLRHPLTLFLFFQRTSAAPRDVDSVVNANCLFHLGDHQGSEAIVEHLLAVLRAGAERDCDKWYDNPFAIWYFFSRALAGRSEEAGRIVVERLANAAPATALEAAFAACALLRWRVRPSEDAIRSLLAAQLASGGWPRAALYHGGRPRLARGGFGAPHPDTPRWGSEELTTGFALEALARWLDADS
ncbi:MAG: hypothetical protein JWN21_1987 [Sphingomonas bacterium]|nr:hypothetical protein [Sphingomonas bacterium]